MVGGRKKQTKKPSASSPGRFREGLVDELKTSQVTKTVTEVFSNSMGRKGNSTMFTEGKPEGKKEKPQHTRSSSVRFSAAARVKTTARPAEPLFGLHSPLS